MKTSISRRVFARNLAGLSLTVAACPPLAWSAHAASAERKMKMCLVPGSIGVKASGREMITLAHKHGFEAVDANAGFLTGLSDGELSELLADMKTKKLVFGASGLSVDFRQDDAKFKVGLEGLPKLAAGLKRAGVERVGTWVSPSHQELNYQDNFKRHSERLREIAKILKDHGLRFGLEYVGTPSSRQNKRNPFIHSLKEMQELIAAIGTGNVGVVLDSWHWWTASETPADLLKLKNADVVSVDLNDAPAGLTLEQQQDGQRELPCATGVIPVAAFLKTLQGIGYDGPVRVEPFNKPLNDLPDDEACAKVIAALRKAMALLS